jgi:hypothetical protein
MKSLLFILTIVVSLSSPAEPFRLKGQAYQPPTNIDIVWKATNDLPHGLWIYRVMPEAFSAAAISNAMTICHFQTNDLAQPPDKNQIIFKNKNEYCQSHVLSIAPTLGGMDYNSQWDYKIPIEDVPSSDKAEALARDILFQLGIDRSSLADKVQKGYDDTSTRYDRQRNLISPTQVIRRGVAFARRIDGLPLSDNRCFLIHFGIHSRIEDFSLLWRNIQRYESRQVLTTEQIIETIKSGKAVLPEQFGDLTDLNTTKKLAITKITPRYYNGVGKEALDFIYPYADLEMTAETGSTNTTTFFLSCPIFSTNVVKP